MILPSDFMYMLNRRGKTNVLCGTPQWTIHLDDISFSHWMASPFQNGVELLIPVLTLRPERHQAVKVSRKRGTSKSWQRSSTRMNIASSNSSLDLKSGWKWCRKSTYFRNSGIGVPLHSQLKPRLMTIYGPRDIILILKTFGLVHLYKTSADIQCRLLAKSKSSLPVRGKKEKYTNSIKKEVFKDGILQLPLIVAWPIAPFSLTIRQSAAV